MDKIQHYTPADQIYPAEALGADQPGGNPPAGIRGTILRVLTDGNLNARDQRNAISSAVVDALQARGQLYYNVKVRNFETALYFDNERARLERIRSDAFQSFLSDFTSINRADTLFAAIMAQVETSSLSDSVSKGIEPETYWATRPGAVFISCGDARLCRITGSGVAMLPNGTDDVLFETGHTLTPWQLVEPADPFETCRLFRDIQAGAANARELVRLWMLSLPSCPKSKPPLCIYGEIGSGKTRLALGINELFGLPASAAAVEDKLEGDFWPRLDAGGVFILDNADTRQRWLPDALATAATGGSVTRRRLYTNDQSITLTARAWMAITTANPTFASDAGLADRLLVIRLKRREGFTSDAALSDEIQANRDAGLSFISHTLAQALADNTATPPGLNARHPDFAALAVKIGRAMGREQQAIAALKSAEADKSLFCLQNDTLGAALLLAVEAGPLEGDAATLKTVLEQQDQAISEWSCKTLGRRLSGLWPHLESVFDAHRTKKQSVWQFRLAKRMDCGFVGLEA